MLEPSKKIITSAPKETPIPQYNTGQVVSQTKPKLTSVKVFYCYAREDEALRVELDKHLMALKQRGWISSWNDQEILAGMEREREIDIHLRTADIILLLVSSDFMNSEYCYGSSMQEAMKRHDAGEAVVIPIILRPVDWRDAPFGKLQALPAAGKPITVLHDRDEALLDVEQGIRAAVKALLRRVFISFAPADDVFAMRLKSDLEARGFTVWSTPDRTESDEMSRENIVQPLIRDAEAVLLIASPNARYDPSIKEDLHIAEMYQQLVVPVWAAGDDWLGAIPSSWDENFYIDAREQRYEEALQKLMGRLGFLTSVSESATTTPALVDSSQSPELIAEPRDPFKGLEPFRSEDARDFFGRDGLVQDLLRALEDSLFTGQQARQAGRLLAVVGPSGSGKSSVAMAGLLPELRKGAIAGSSEWTYLQPILPGAHPFEALAKALASDFPQRSLESLREDLEANSALGLHLLASQIAKRPDSKVVLLVDQFEELFTLTTSKEKRQRFIDVLVAAITEPRGPVVVILTLRADFYDRPTQYPELARLIEKHHRLVLPMDLKDLRSVIEGPVKLPDVQLNFEGDLVGDLLFDVQGQAGALPLLQFTLDQLFQRRSGHLLTFKAYYELGGVKGSLSKKAEETYAALSTDEHRRLARALFMRLIDPGATEQDTTRRRAALTELSLPDPKQTQMLEDVADAFVIARLLTTNEIAGTPTIEVSHEALIRAWKRLAEWLHEARDDIRFQQDFSDDVEEWERRKQPKDRLYRGTQLKEAQDWGKRNMTSEREGAFLRASTFQRRLSIVRLILIFCLLISSGGGLTWYITHLPAVPADPTLVANLKDSGSGSLRWCIASASPGSTIKFAPSVRGTIKLISSDISIDKNLIIRGPGASLLAISSTGPSIRVSPHTSVTISGLSFKDGKFTNTGFIVSEGNLIVTNTTFSNNQVHDETANFYGGSLTNSNTGNLTVTNSTFLNNSAESGGGAITSDSTDNLTVTNSTFLNNSTQSGGGAIFSAISSITVTNSTFSNNSASYRGGAIYSYWLLTVTNSTFLNNQAQDNGGAIDIEDSSGPTSFLFCTFYGNGSSSNGGSIWINPKADAHKVTLTNSIVAANQASTGLNIAGKLTTGGYNLLQDSVGATFLDPNRLHSTDKEVIQLSDLKIDSQLSNNDKPTQTLAIGGHTQTLKLQQGSPAIDAIPLATCQVTFQDASGRNMTITTDQLNDSRPDEPGGSCDIGAYESSY